MEIPCLQGYLNKLIDTVRLKYDFELYESLYKTHYLLLNSITLDVIRP